MEAVGLAEAWHEAADTKTVPRIGRQSEGVGLSGPWAGPGFEVMAEVGCMAAQNIEKGWLAGEGRNGHKGRSLSSKDKHGLGEPDRNTRGEAGEAA